MIRALSLAPRRARVLAAVLALAVAMPAVSGAQAAETEKLEPADSLEGNYLAAIIAGASRDTSAAAVFFREALREDPRNSELLERAFVVFLADGAMNDAFAAADRLIKRDPQSGLANLALGVRALKTRQYERARTIFAKGARGRAADITATLLGAWALGGAGEGKKALESIDRLRADPATAVFRDYHAGLIADLAGNKSEASRRLKSAYDAEQMTLRVVDVYGRFEARRGDIASAKAVYQNLQKVLPDQPIVNDALAKLDAGKTLQPAIANAQQGAAEVLYGLGAVGGRQDDNVAALIYLRLALYLDPGHTMAMVTLGNVLERGKQIEKAIALYDQIPADSPLKASADIQVGLSLESIGKSEEATKRLEAVAAAQPENADAVTALGNVLRNRKKYAEAAEVYTKAMGLLKPNDPANWTLLYFRGMCLERAKQWPKAEADLKKALELIPEGLKRERAYVLNYLGYSWVDQNVNVDEAFDMLKRAVALQPRDGSIVDSLGWAYYRLGRYDEAVKELERAIELRPADAVVNDHLGDAYWKTGRKLEANFQWNHARDMNPEPEDLEKILVKLKEGIPDDKPAVEAERPKMPEPTKDGG